MNAPRILVTGSRTWTDPWLVASALNRAATLLGPETVLVHGACPKGADTLAHGLWAGAGRPIEPHPADWGVHDPKCPDSHRNQARCKSAGYRRNALMVELGADLCLAFNMGGSPGATMTARMAERAGIETWRFELDLSETPRCFLEHQVHSTPHRSCLLR